MYEVPADKKLYVIFTIVEFPQGVPNVNVTNLPDPVKLPLPQALENVQARITAGTFKLELPLINGGYGSIIADTDFFEEVNRDPNPDCPTTIAPPPPQTTASSGPSTTTSDEGCGADNDSSGYSAGKNFYYENIVQLLLST